MATYLLYRPKVYLGSWELVGSACQPCTCKRQRVRFAKLIQYETRPQNNVSKKFLRKTTTCPRLVTSCPRPCTRCQDYGGQTLTKDLGQDPGQDLAILPNCAITCPRLAQDLPPLAQDYKVPRLWRSNSCPGSWARSWARFGHLAQLRNNFLLGINALPYGLRTTNKTTVTMATAVRMSNTTSDNLTTDYREL